MPDSMPDYPWYAVGVFDNLQQGDLFPNCSIVVPDPKTYDRLLSESDGSDLRMPNQPILVIEVDVMVVSQSCDIAKSDCTQILVCQYHPAADYSKERRAEIAKDRLAALHMIEACDLEGVAFSQQVLDFRAVYTAPKDFLMALARSRGKRARLLPPYREHMAQAFARYFMRVGLPRNLKRDA